jgi:hypothetical protein
VRQGGVHTKHVSDFKPGHDPPHLQWATDPAGGRYWIQGVPAFGRSGWTLVFGKSGPPEIMGMITVERVEGDQRTGVFMQHCYTLEEARALAVALADQIEAGTFQEQPPG